MIATHRALIAEGIFHETPRLGNTNQLSDIFQEDKTKGYVVGILCIAIIIAIVFLCWGLFLLLLKCTGKNRVGFLSGAPYEAQINGQPNPRFRRGRIVFGFSSVMFIVSILVLVFAGLGNLESSREVIAEGATLGQRLLSYARGLGNVYYNSAEVAAGFRDDVVENLEEVFESGQVALANHSNTVLLSNDTLLLLVNEAAEEINLQEEATKLIQFLESLKSLVGKFIRDLGQVITEGEEFCKNVSDGLTIAQMQKVQLGLGVPLTIMGLLMILLMGATIKGPTNGAKHCCTAWFVTPVFVFVTLFVILLFMGLSIGATVNSDFCSGGADETPESTLLQTMDAKGINPGSLKYKAVDYLIHGCMFEVLLEDQNPWAIYEGFAKELKNATDLISLFQERIEDIGISTNAADFSKNISGADEELKQLKEMISTMFGTMKDLLDGLACERLYDVYSKVVDDAICTYSHTGVAWCFISLMLISFFGMMMLTFRSVLYPLAGVDNSDEYSWNQNQAKHANVEKEGPASSDFAHDDEAELKGYSEYTVNDGVESGAQHAKPPSAWNDEFLMDGAFDESASARYDGIVGHDNPFIVHPESK